MDTALFAARLLLAAVFAVAGGAKLRDRAGAAGAAAGLGVPPRLARPLSRALPAVELAVAAALLAPATARAGAAAALVLLAGFSALVAANLVRGRRPPCHCFGHLGSGEVGPATLARNALLGALAAAVAGQGGGTAPAVATAGAGPVALAVGAALVAVAVVEGWFIVHLLRQHGRLLVRLDALEARVGLGEPAAPAPLPTGGLPVGTPAPGFSLPDVDGQARDLPGLLAGGRPLLLVFSAPGCGPCESLMPEVGRWQREAGSGPRVVVVSTGPLGAVAAIAAEHGLVDVLRQEAHEVAERYRYLGTPSAVVVGPDGRIAGPLVAGAEAIRGLWEAWTGGGARLGPGAQPVALARTRTPRSPAPGDRLPDVGLADPGGAAVDLRAVVAGPTLLVSWNPACSFCAAMLDDLRAWDRRPPEGAPALVVVSSGSGEEARAMALRSPVLVDHDGRALAALGLAGTPMAVLVDASGRVASPPVAGAAQVFELAGGRPATVAVGDARKGNGRG